ncbi:MAG: orotidine-5'-phosphate decarboxylase [Candidatus Komeilibacteria bacterium CG10_big_fil_rev_8_21_14_0_10_41_13]|uniref:Orotidine 5'-phosphate decarboxylase n=1 Tax=Candidatus Komeilibacteria bacterium CG10_big_fil_rev_8_21_14_0_10_41_13 TaxID=1974476 RepID=A0A2M6WCV9_9BACT|nr:MAG: orotidine-5'-phosphate decarboxylase [Candidatus Komeilibacteria bacterium CG10_big_fil_rev_8_21_14_0_10_41_13]
MKNLPLAERLIVAADYAPNPNERVGALEVQDQVMRLADTLRGTGVVIKVNSVLRFAGYSLIRQLHNLQLKVMADLKLIDIPNTMKIDGQLLAEFKPELLTVMACNGVNALMAIRKVLPETEILAVTALTSLDEEECQLIFGCSTKAAVRRFARFAQLAGLGGLVLSPKEVEAVKNNEELVLSLNTPGIRPEFSLVQGDDQARVMTPRKAMAAGAERIVIGRPILQHDNPFEAVQMVLKEIQLGLTDRESSL